MADSFCIAELKETIEKMNAELSQSHTKISELDAKVREQAEAAQKETKKLQEQNAQFDGDLKEVNEFNDDTVDIDHLPDEMILEVFGYLKQNQLGQIARVCRRWSVLTKSPTLWKKVNVKFSTSDRSQITIAKSFINGLPTCVTSIRLDFSECTRRIVSLLDFEELCKKLLEKCPHLETLMLTNSDISNSLPSVIDLCTQFLQNLKNLVFHGCIFSSRTAKKEFGCIFSSRTAKKEFGCIFSSRTAKKEFGCTLKFEVFDLNCSVFEPFDNAHFSRMPCLKVLCLSDTHIDDTLLEDTSFLNQLRVLNLGFTRISSRTFPAIHKHGYNLKELYLCEVRLQDHDLNFNKSVFPHLKTICLSGSSVTCEGVVSLIQSCPSLQNVYVKSDVAKSFTGHPFVVANRCKSGIVKVIDWFHIHKVDHLHS